MSNFEPVVEKDLCILKVPNVFDPVLPEIKDELEELLKLSCFVFVADFKDIRKMSRYMMTTFVKFSNALKDSDRFFHAINLHRDVRKDINEEGLSEIFAALKNLEEVRAKHHLMTAAKAPLKVDVNFINPFIIATYEALKVQANLDAKAQRPAMKGKIPLSPIGIAGQISLNSPGFKGNIVLCFPTEVFLKIYEILVGEKHTEIGKEIEDFAAELLNIIYGQAKLKLNADQGYAMEQAIPVVLSGQKLANRPKSPTSTMVLPFDTPVGAFHIEIEMTGA